MLWAFPKHSGGVEIRCLEFVRWEYYYESCATNIKAKILIILGDNFLFYRRFFDVRKNYVLWYYRFSTGYNENPLQGQSVLEGATSNDN